MTIGTEINPAGLDDLLAASGFSYVSFNYLFAAANHSLNNSQAPSARTIVKLDRTTRRLLKVSSSLPILTDIFGARFNRDGMLQSWRIQPHRRWSRWPGWLWSPYDLAIVITIKTPVAY